MGYRDDAAAIQGDLADLRWSLHQEPEVGLDLPLTQAKVLDALAGLPLEVATGRSLSSVTAVLRGGRPGRAVLLRGDMDALQVTERTALPRASLIDGVMHACGHDQHMAILVGAARLLAARREALAGDVIFMFQPGEEGCDGAGAMIAEGVLDAAGVPVVAAYALHVMSGGSTVGTFTSRAGTLQASSNTLAVTVRGMGGHGSAPHLAQDPIPAACEMVLSLQTMVSRRFDIFDPIVITVGTFHAGTRDNVIPEEATFSATVRTFSARALDLVEAESVRLVRSIAEAHGLEVDAEFSRVYPPTVNDPDETEFVRETVTEVFGADRYRTAKYPIAGAEDFSRILERVPGCFVHLGAVPEGRDPETAAYNHSPLAVFDDGALADGAALLAELAERRLAAAASSAAS